MRCLREGGTSIKSQDPHAGAHQLACRSPAPGQKASKDLGKSKRTGILYNIL